MCLLIFDVLVALFWSFCTFIRSFAHSPSLTIAASTTEDGYTVTCPFPKPFWLSFLLRTIVKACFVSKLKCAWFQKTQRPKGHCSSKQKSLAFHARFRLLASSRHAPIAPPSSDYDVDFLWTTTTHTSPL